MSNTVKDVTDTRARRNKIIVRSGKKAWGAGTPVAKKTSYGADHAVVNLIEAEIIYSKCWLKHLSKIGLKSPVYVVSRSYWFACGAVLTLLCIGLVEILL